MTGRQLQVGDKVVSTVGVPDDHPHHGTWESRKTNPGIVVHIAARQCASANVTVIDLGLEGGVRHYYADRGNLRVVEASTYEPQHDFRAGQVWRRAGDVECRFYFAVQRTPDEPLRFVDEEGDPYLNIAAAGRPLTLVFDPAVTS